MKNLIFLDFDGVLNNQASLLEGVHICADKVILLRNFCEQYDCSIVISSYWREGRTLQELKDILMHVGFYCPHRIIGMTPVSDSKDGNFTGYDRGYEIEKWLHYQNEDYHYVILDDECDMLEYQMSRLVKIDSNIGLISLHLQKMKDVLGL
jgi:hypothetical protein